MTLAEFARERNIDTQVVSKYLQRHGHLYSRESGLTEEQYNLLDEMYPIPKPVVVINGLPPEEERTLRQQLANTQNEVIRLHNLVSSTQLQLSEQQHQVALVELREQAKDKEIERLTEQLEIERNKSWFDRLFRRK